MTAQGPAAQFGFAAVDLDALRKGGRLMQLGSPLPARGPRRTAASRLTISGLTGIQSWVIARRPSTLLPALTPTTDGVLHQLNLDRYYPDSITK